MCLQILDGKELRSPRAADLLSLAPPDNSEASVPALLSCWLHGVLRTSCAQDRARPCKAWLHALLQTALCTRSSVTLPHVGGEGQRPLLPLTEKPWSLFMEGSVPSPSPVLEQCIAGLGSWPPGLPTASRRSTPCSASSCSSPASCGHCTVPVSWLALSPPHLNPAE